MMVRFLKDVRIGQEKSYLFARCILPALFLQQKTNCWRYTLALNYAKG